MKTNKQITVSEILRISENNHLCTLILRDASRYAVNSRGQMEINHTIWESKHIGGYRADILEQELNALAGKGEVYMAFAKIDQPIIAEIVK